MIGNKPGLLNRIRHKLIKRVDKYLAPIRKMKLKYPDFTIISNNCWGGICYEYYGLQKNSPTVGTYFFASDYLRFIGNFNYYVNQDIKMITVEESKHKQTLIKRGDSNCPIGVLEDVEIVFMHYSSPQIAKEKWNRRIKRINKDNLIFKFSYMNECSKDDLKEFDTMNLPGKKFMFVNISDHKYKCGIYYPGYENEGEISNDTFYWNKYFDVTAFLNGEGVKII